MRARHKPSNPKMVAVKLAKASDTVRKVHAGTAPPEATDAAMHDLFGDDDTDVTGVLDVALAAVRERQKACVRALDEAAEKLEALTTIETPLFDD